MIDLSHANSAKDHRRQNDVASEVCAQLRAGERRIVGVMVESNLRGGRQDIVPGRPLAYGQSVTDACLGWEESVPLVEELAAAVRRRRAVSSRRRSARRRAG
jgi:3-deoxy-7-phosphoheptulonate synthase